MFISAPSLDDPDLKLGVLLNTWPETSVVFLKYKMLCVGCLVNPFQGVTDACLEYCLDEKEFREELRCAILKVRTPMLSKEPISPSN